MPPSTHADITLIGGGIMSATLGMLLKTVRPDASIAVIERLDETGLESSDPWNNAGTGHAAYCELHYTPERPDESIDVTRAVVVNEQWQQSVQFYAWLVDQGIAPDPSVFINPVPHCGFAVGEVDVKFLRRRHATMSQVPSFAHIAFSDDPAQIAAWLPLVMDGRTDDEPIAVTRTAAGTDVNFGALTRLLFEALQNRGVAFYTGTEVRRLQRQAGGWSLSLRTRHTGEERTHSTGFVFVGAGGAAVHLLQRAGIPEVKGYGGFPVSGQFLRCTNPALIDRHDAKVYGRPATGAPPMTAPHLDTRFVAGRRGLMFGPYAGFSPRFLKQGSRGDLPRSIRRNSIGTMLSVARDEIPLTRYLVRQVLQSMDDRIDQLRKFMPAAASKDWELIEAGQRVQIMRPAPGKRGILQFGTEVVTAQDGSIAGLLGASPGASTATAIMLDVIERCFPHDFRRALPQLRDIVPTLGTSVATDPVRFKEMRSRTDRILKLSGSQLPA